MPISQTGDYFAEHIDSVKIFELFENAFSYAESKRFRNNIIMLRMAFRYTVLASNKNPSDFEVDELNYIYTNFNSYQHKGGYGIAIPKKEITEKKIYDKWYEF